jgi:hypothetical protein
MVKKLVSSVPVISSCPHVDHAQVLWMETQPGEPPEFCFSGFPNSGRIMMSKQTVIIVCHRCARELNNLQKPVTNEIHLAC